MEATVGELEHQLAERARELDTREAALRETADGLGERERRLVADEDSLASRRAEFAAQELDVVERERSVESQEEELAARERSAVAREDEVGERERALASLQNEITELDRSNADREADFSERESAVSVELERLERERVDWDAALQAAYGRLDSLEADLVSSLSLAGMLKRELGVRESATAGGRIDRTTVRDQARRVVRRGSSRRRARPLLPSDRPSSSHSKATRTSTIPRPRRTIGGRASSGASRRTERLRPLDWPHRRCRGEAGSQRSPDPSPFSSRRSPSRNPSPRRRRSTTSRSATRSPRATACSTREAPAGAPPGPTRSSSFPSFASATTGSGSRCSPARAQRRPAAASGCAFSRAR